jgi:MFS superfamily sulfate permease-like transporter
MASFITMLTFIGSQDNWNVLKSHITTTTGLSIAGAVCLCIASIIYFTQDPTNAIYFAIFLSCLSLGLSYSAIAVSAISKT